MRTSTGSSGLLALCLVAFCLACPLRIAADYDMDDAVGLWLLDDGEGDVAKDSSATGDHGKLWRGPTWVDGRLGQAHRFDGQSCVGAETEFDDIVIARPGASTD